MKNYNEFVNSRLNEEAEFGSNKAASGLGGLFKNLLGGLLKGVADEFKKPLEDLNKKLGTQKNVEDMVKTVNAHLLGHRETLVTSLENSKTLASVLETVEDGINTAYLSIDASIKNFGTDTFTFDELFKNAPERTKKLFSKDERSFGKKFKPFARELILSLGKPFKITKDELDKSIEEDKKKTSNESIIINKKLGILNEDAPPEATQTNDAQTNDAQTNDAQTNDAQTNATQTDQNNAAQKVGQGEQKAQDVNKSTENLTKLKESIQNWFDSTIYKTTKTLLEEVKKGGNKPKEQGDINTAIENIPADVTEHKDSIKSMVNKLATSDKKTMKAVRDALGLTIKDAPL